MAKSRASKGLLVPPQPLPIPDATSRESWLAGAVRGFVSSSAANREIYALLLDLLWPSGHGIPGPTLSENEIRSALNLARANRGKGDYLDVFRRFRELQGDEGFTSIIKEGTKYQLRSLDIGPKREPRAKPSKSLWKKILHAADHRCAHCGEQEPSIRLSPDHRIPRSRNGTNEDWNWQPLCEQCNNAKSSACRGCSLNCSTCFWAHPETYKPIVLDDDNREQIRRASDQAREDQSQFTNRLLREHFRGAPYTGRSRVANFRRPPIPDQPSQGD